MPTRWFLLNSLFGCLLVGCDQAPPAPPSDVIGDAIDKGFDELHKQIEAADEELELRAVSFLIDGVRDDEHSRELFSKVQSLEDIGTTKNRVASLGAYYQTDVYFRISPISDIEAAAEKINFGQVMAVDSANRVVLVDASAQPAPRPAKGWPDATAIDEYVVRKTVSWAAGQAYADWVTKFGPENVVVVSVPEEPQETPGVSLSPDQHPIIRKLRTLAPETLASSFPGFGPQGKNFITATVAPVQDLEDVIKALDGETILAVDKERRVVLLGDLAGLKPAPVIEKRQPNGTLK